MTRETLTRGCRLPLLVSTALALLSIPVHGETFTDVSAKYALELDHGLHKCKLALYELPKRTLAWQMSLHAGVHDASVFSDGSVVVTRRGGLPLTIFDKSGRTRAEIQLDTLLTDPWKNRILLSPRASQLSFYYLTILGEDAVLYFAGFWGEEVLVRLSDAKQISIDRPVRELVDRQVMSHVRQVLRDGIEHAEDIRCGNGGGRLANIIRATVLVGNRRHTELGNLIQGLQDIALPLGAVPAIREKTKFRPDFARGMIYRQLAACTLVRLGIQPSLIPRTVLIGEWLDATPAHALGANGPLSLKAGQTVNEVLFRAGCPLFFDAKSWVYLAGVGKEAVGIRVVWEGAEVQRIEREPEFLRSLDDYRYLGRE